MKPRVHGKASTYSNHKCRCEECRAAWRVHTALMRDGRAKVARENPDAVPHGAHGYVNWRCRCPVCRAGHAARHREWREQAKAAKQTPPDLTP